MAEQKVKQDKWGNPQITKLMYTPVNKNNGTVYEGYYKCWVTIGGQNYEIVVNPANVRDKRDNPAAWINITHKKPKSSNLGGVRKFGSKF